MTTPQGTQSTFTAQSDSAALALRGILQKNGADIEASSSVVVGPDGKPPAPPPPQGSYARMAMDAEAARRAEDVIGQPPQAQQLGDQPVAGTPEQMVDGSQAPPLTPPGQAAPDTQASPYSEGAQARIQDLVSQLRDKDQRLQQITTDHEAGQRSAVEVQSQLDGLTSQYQTLIDGQLESLDPETRAQVMADARIREQMTQLESRLMQRISPAIEGIAENQRNTEMMQLGGKYPAFDVQIHGPLIEMYRAKNPNSSIEQAFLASTVDTPEERVTREAAQAHALPPVMPPGNGPAQPRYIAEPQGQPVQDPDAELRSDAVRFAELMRSDNPSDHKTGADLALKNIGERVFGPR